MTVMEGAGRREQCVGCPGSKTLAENMLKISGIEEVAKLVQRANFSKSWLITVATSNVDTAQTRSTKKLNGEVF